MAQIAEKKRAVAVQEAITAEEISKSTDSDAAEALQRVFETIDQLEKTEIESKVRVIYSEMFPLVLIQCPDTDLDQSGGQPAFHDADERTGV